MSDMGSYYQCSDPDSNEKNWTGHIRPLNINRNEFEVTARGSTFHLLVGKHAYGKYLCIPNWGIGTETVSYTHLSEPGSCAISIVKIAFGSAIPYASSGIR